MEGGKNKGIGRTGMRCFVGLLFLIMYTSQMNSQVAVNTEEPRIDSLDVSRTAKSDTVNCFVSDEPFAERFVHQLGVELRPAYIIPSNVFLKGENEAGRRIRKSYSAHLRYAFKAREYSCMDVVYGGVYQGLGLAYYSFFEPTYLGNPVALYLFQGARIGQGNDRMSLHYEWNFGLSAGWKPYDPYTNGYNLVIGSKLNAYLNLNLYVNWVLSNRLDLITGIDLTHFSNGNTKFPNSGLNTVGLKLGLVYNFNKADRNLFNSSYRTLVPAFVRHTSYDLVLFGSWRRKGVAFGEQQIASPHVYPVGGFNFAPMYNFDYKVRAGISLDGVYDGSANIYTEADYYGDEVKFMKPALSKQLALGLSGRFEYVMPYFSVNLGLGVNLLHRGGDLKSVYQTLALKADITRNSFIHIGYCLHDFHEPNYLMLGIGYRFNNHYPFFSH